MIDADALRHHRLLRGLSQRALAKRIGVNAMTIQRLEAGAEHSDLSISHLVRLCAELAVDANTLLPRTTPCTAVSEQPTEIDPRPLDLNEVRLLRRIHRAEPVQQRMNQTERTITLPALINRGAIDTSAGCELSDATKSSLQVTLHSQAGPHAAKSRSCR